LRDQWGEAEPSLAKALDECPDTAAAYVTMSELQKNQELTANFATFAEPLRKKIDSSESIRGRKNEFGKNLS